ncbi:E3 ubiquitin-protein ligase AIP2 [Fistulifera solaris]|uniref:E3 ubiquitin-protein ligase AIP2 n=1 Tax=Fistulifera solaris TaxID=1519565 RepID=A0A1Z5JD78_FISSO|nr:E3 ubiquitin-protein ligase AIP2 [Fistulifera solaris]|eukprot:GAX11728.1 E3 ubiquitin-protein ligase AIP2 [Fistulifera solaris]
MNMNHHQRNRADENDDVSSFSFPGFFQNFPNLASSFANQLQDQIFQSDMAAALRASMQQSQPPQPVAASHQAIRQLPTVKVSREDLIDPCNRECCICLEGIQLGHSVLRLPCAHVYHPPCIQQWLTNHGNTCPVCRYELPVDNNPEYERGRQERMRCRKPRFAQHELDRLSIAQLKQLLPQSQRTTRRFAERRELVECLIQSGVIDVVATPEPVRHRLSELRAMSISRLKATMNDAGVFFDAKEVVEKSDMIHIFVASGRLQLLEEPEEDRKPAARPVHKLTVETVNLEDPRERLVDEREDTSILMEENINYVRSNTCVVEAQQPEDADCLSAPSIRSNDNDEVSEGTRDEFLEHYSLASDQPFRRKRRRHESDDPKVVVLDEDLPVKTGEIGDCVSSSDETDAEADPLLVSAETSSEGSWTRVHHAAQRAESSVAESDLSNSKGTSSKSGNELEETIRNTEQSSSSQSVFDLDRQNISQLKALARAHSIDLSGCLERTEIICCLTDKLRLDETSQSSSSRNDASHQVLSHPLDNWAISEIRALAALSEVDLSNCQSRDEMINLLNATAIARPHVANYFQTLAPLAQLTVPQLRTVARERQIHVLDCIEKGDIIQRLVRSMRDNPVSET